MTVLADWQIRERVKNEKFRNLFPEKALDISPFCDYGECSSGVVSFGLTSGGYDIRVGTTFLLFCNTSACIVDPKNFRREAFTEVESQVGEGVVIPPNCFALADTVEYIKMPRDLLGEVKGKSRLARTGYIMASTPIEPAWRGKITLEIGNLSPLPMKVYAGEGIGQLVFYKLDALPEKDYDQKPNKRFQDQKGLTGPEGVWKPSTMMQEAREQLDKLWEEEDMGGRFTRLE